MNKPKITRKWHYIKPTPDLTPQEASRLAIDYMTDVMNKPKITHKWHYIKPMPDLTPQEALELAIAYVTAAMNPPDKIERYGLAKTPFICDEAVEQLPGPLQRHFEDAGEYEDGDYPG